MSQQPHRGRPTLPDAERADSQLQLRVQRRRKSAYVRAANKSGQTLSAWSMAQLDAASGYVEE